MYASVHGYDIGYDDIIYTYTKHAYVWVIILTSLLLPVNDNELLHVLAHHAMTTDSTGGKLNIPVYKYVCIHSVYIYDRVYKLTNEDDIRVNT